MSYPRSSSTDVPHPHTRHVAMHTHLRHPPFHTSPPHLPEKAWHSSAAEHIEDNIKNIASHLQHFHHHLLLIIHYTSPFPLFDCLIVACEVCVLHGILKSTTCHFTTSSLSLEFVSSTQLESTSRNSFIKGSPD